MKNYLIILLVLISVGISGCGGDKKPANNSAPNVTKGVEPVADAEVLSIVDPDPIPNAGVRSQRLQELGEEVLSIVAVLVRLAVTDEDLAAHRRILPEKSLVFPRGRSIAGNSRVDGLRIGYAAAAVDEVPQRLVAAV